MDSDEDESGPMSEEEEENLDYLLSGTFSDSDDDEYTPPRMTQASSQSTCDSQSSQGSTDPLFHNSHMYFWQDDSVADKDAPDPRTTQFKPKREPGIQLGRVSRGSSRNFTTPADFLQLFLTPAFLLNICIATNTYAKDCISKGQRMSYTQADGLWEDLTVEEITRFLGIVIYMSIAKFQSMEKYWSSSPLYSNNPVPNVMSRMRFQSILSFLQVTPPADIDKSKKLTRIQPMIDHVSAVSKEYYHPRMNVAVDERMVSSKHKYSGIRQFMKDKPCRFGIKLWILACNNTGYTYNFFVYLGKKHSEFVLEKSKGLAYNIVMKLCEPILDQGYRLFTDCFYTSLSLGKDLLVKSTYLVGVLKSNSTSMPVEFKDSKEWGKIVSRGDYRWIRNEQFVFVQWKDCKVVTFMSPLHTGSSVTVCHRTMKSRLSWSKKCLKQPKIADDYNQGMGAVDLSNQYVNKYPSYIRSQTHWWKVLFFHLLDIIVMNSYILYKDFENSGKTVSVHCPGQLEYRESISLFLMKKGLVFPPKPIKSECIPEFDDKRHDCVCCNAAATLEQRKPPSYKTAVLCKSCNVYLCLTRERNCFKKWHSDEGKTIREYAKSTCRKRKLNV